MHGLQSKQKKSAIVSPAEEAFHDEAALDLSRIGSAVSRAGIDVSRVTARDVMALQRRIGNQATAHLLGYRQNAPNPQPAIVRSNLTVGRTHHVSRHHSPHAIQRIPSGSPTLQRTGRWDAFKEYTSDKWNSLTNSAPKHERNRLPEEGAVRGDLTEVGVLGGSMGAAYGLGEGLSSAGSGFPASVGVLNSVTGILSGMAYKRGTERDAAATKRGDLAGSKLGKGQARTSKWGMLGAAAGTTQSALGLATAAEHGATGLMTADKLITGAQFLSTGLGVAGAAAGIAGGAVTAGMGGWKAGKAAAKLWKLSKSKQMLSEDGERWRARIKDREKTKIALNTLKIIGGALGIAAGALVIASNPVGWALGIAAAATVGGLAAYKLYNNIKRKKRKKDRVSSTREEMTKEPSEGDTSDDWKLADYGRMWGVPGAKQTKDAGKAGGEDMAGGNEGGGEGAELEQADPAKLDEARRKQAVDLGNRVAKNAGKSGKVAWEMRQVLGYRTSPGFSEMEAMLAAGAMTPQQLRDGYNKDEPYHKKLLMSHDALVLLGVLKLKPEEVESESGQELIEHKLSATGTL